jgi:hypothetical protein
MNREGEIYGGGALTERRRAPREPQESCRTCLNDLAAFTRDTLFVHVLAVVAEI